MSEDTYNLSPSKQAYQAVKADVTPVSAFKELIDNALDNWQRVLQGLDPISIEIEYHPDGPNQEEKIVVRDDAGGVEEEDVSILFALGQSKKESIGGAIGAYGVGAKKAIVNLGNEAVIKSRHLHAETGFGFEVDQEWLETENNWNVDKLQFDDIEQGVTEIIIQDLNISWDNYKDDLESNLSETYQHFLESERFEDQENIEIIIREFDREGDVEDEVYVEPPEGVEWSFTPVDELYPRRYEDIELESKEFDQTVKLNVTVGLMKKANADEAGADIFCQDRKVLAAVGDNRAGFGTGAGSTRLGKFSGQHRRLKVIIEFETEGDSQILPWDAQKSDIDPYNRVSQAAQDWIRRIVKPYYQAAGAYDEIPTTLLSPYGRDNEYAVTEKLDEPYDYGGGRERVSHKPDTDFEDAGRITRRVATTAALAVYSPGNLEEKFIPAYRADLERVLRSQYNIDVNAESLPTEDVPEVAIPEEIDEEAATALHRDLERRASRHARRSPPIRDDRLDGFEQVIYDRALRRELETQEIETPLEELETLADGDEDTADETDTTVAESQDTEGQATDDTDGTIDQSSFGASDDAEAGEGGTDTTGTKIFSEDDEADTEADEDMEANGESDEEAGDEGATDVKATETETYRLELSKEEWEELTQALDLDPDVSEAEVREQLMNKADALKMIRA